MSPTKPADPRPGTRFTSLEQQAFVNLLRTADSLVRAVEETLKPTGLSLTQYNALRILRGAGPEGLACGQVAERMLTRDPDITRLLDRLETRGLVARARERRDRRIVQARITRKGLELLKPLDEPVAALHRRQLGHLGPSRLRALLHLLNIAQERVGKLLNGGKR